MSTESTTVTNGGYAQPGAAAAAASPVISTITVQAASGEATFNLELDANAALAPASYISGWTTAATLLSEAIDSPITVNLEIGYTEYPEDNSPVSSGFGFGGVAYGANDTYTEVRNFLSGTGATNVISAIDALPNTSSLNGVSSFFVASTEEKAFGQISPTASAIDGFVGFGSGIDSSSIVAVALHEFTHAMGRVAGNTVLSLFDYTSPASHYFGSTGANSYFSIDGGNTVLANFAFQFDPGDFLNDSLSTNDPFDEFYTSTTLQSLTSLDLTMLDMLGFGSGTSRIENVGSGAIVSGSVVAGGHVQNVLSGGVTIGTVVESGGVQNVFAGGVASGTEVESGGTQNILSGGLDSAGIISGGGYQIVDSGGVASGTVVSNGGQQEVLAGGSAGSIVVSAGGGERISSGGAASGSTVSSGGFVAIESGGTATGTTVSSGATEFVSGGAIASGTIVSAGGFEIVLAGGVDSGGFLSSGGYLEVQSGGTAFGAQTLPGGGVWVFTGGSASGTRVGSGFAAISSGGNGTGTVLSGGGLEFVSGGANASFTVISSGGFEVVLSGGVASASVASSGGYQEMLSGGVARVTWIETSGGAYIFNGGTASGSIVSGGFQTVENGGSAFGTTVSSGGIEWVSGGGRASGTVVSSGGFQEVLSGGIASGSVVSSGGYIVVSSGGTANNASINGGLVEIRRGGAATSVVFAAGSGTLELDDSVHFTGTVCNFVTRQDIIDLRDIGFNSATTNLTYTQLVGSGTLSVTDGVSTANITLLGTHSPSNFTLEGDGVGGTAILDPPQPDTPVAAGALPPVTFADLGSVPDGGSGGNNIDPRFADATAADGEAAGTGFGAEGIPIGDTALIPQQHIG